MHAKPAPCFNSAFRIHAALILALSLLLHASLAAGSDPNYNLCFPSTTWFGSPTGPNINIFKINDPGWEGSFRYVFGSGTISPDVIVQGIRDSDSLFLFIEGENLPLLTAASGAQTATIVLAFDFRQPGQNGPLQRIVLHPVLNAPASPPSDPSLVTGAPSGVRQLWIGTRDPNAPIVGTTNSPVWVPVANPSWLGSPNAQVGYQGPAGDYRWYLSVKLPITGDPNTGLAIPPSGVFGFYVNVFRTVNLQYQESWWPPKANLDEPGCPDNSNIGSCNPVGQTPDPGPVADSTWGTANVNASSTCGGVSVGSQVNNIYTDNSPISKISLDNPNSFHAYVQNTSVDSTGNPIAAQQIKATFKIANFGLPSLPSWSEVPTGVLAMLNITQTAMTSGTATYSWTLSSGSGTAPAPGQTPIVTVFGTTNGGGIFNVTDLQTSNWSGSTSGTFKIAGFSGGTTTFAGAAETGQAIVRIFPATNPTGYQNIPASTCSGAANNGNANCTLSTGPWTLLPVQQTAYQSANSEHQCILVELDSAPGTGNNTTILNNAAVQNMDFGLGASRFSRVAEISAKGYPLRPPDLHGTQNTDQLFDLQVFSEQKVLSSGQGKAPYDQSAAANQNPGKGDNRFVSQLTWVVHGCRHTGRFMFVDEQKIEICDPIGAFGYQVRHVGSAPVTNWNVKLTGVAVETVSANRGLYRIHVPQDGVATVTTVAEPKEQSIGGEFAAFFDAGAAVPHGSFSSVFNTGFSLNAGLEYIATSQFSVEGIFGYHRFPGITSAGLSLYQFSVDGKLYFSSGSLRPFANGGIGGYKFDPGATKFSGNVGAGLLYNITPKFGLQGSYNLHVSNTPGGATRFSTLQGGIRFGF